MGLVSFRMKIMVQNTWVNMGVIGVYGLNDNFLIFSDNNRLHNHHLFTTHQNRHLMLTEVIESKMRNAILKNMITIK